MVMKMSLTPQVRKIGKNGREHVQSVIRMPVAVSDALRQLALANERSLNAEIVHRIVSTLPDEMAELTDEHDPVQPSVLLQIAADIRAMREMQERQQRSRVEVTPPRTQLLRHFNGEGT